MKPSLVDRAWAWLSTLPLATVIVLLGLFFYSGLAADYEAFYSPLSVELRDIGLDYTAILARSGEQIATPLLLVILSYSMLRLSREAATEGELRAGRAYTGRWRWLRVSRAWSRTFASAIIAVVVALVFIVYELEVYSIKDRTKASVSAVREGRPIEGIKSKNGFTLLNVHVREARIEPVAKTNVASAITKLAGRPILYVGQADGTLVLFDPMTDRAIYLPRNSVTLSVGSESR
jgi:hypothetical protein